MTHIERPEALRYELVRRQQETRPERPRQSHHASDAEACLRRLWYAWHNAPADNPRFRDNMAHTMGKATESFASALLSSFYTEEQRFVEHPVGTYSIHGYADFVLGLTEEEWQRFFPQYAPPSNLLTEHGTLNGIPVEVKSLRTRLYEESVMRGPLPSHVGQLNLYALGIHAPFGLLMYVQREAIEGVPFNLWLIGVDRDRLALIQKRLRRLERFLELDLVPPPACPAPDRLDPGCPYAGARCRSDNGFPASSCAGCGDPLSPLEVGWHAVCQRALGVGP